jgi:hypothetical protein
MHDCAWWRISTRLIVFCLTSTFFFLRHTCAWWKAGAGWAMTDQPKTSFSRQVEHQAERIPRHPGRAGGGRHGQLSGRDHSSACN